MARIISISGSSASGKTSIFQELKSRKELENAVFIPDIFKTVWSYLVDGGYFSEYDDISKDTDFLCVFIQRIINHYKENIDYLADSDKLVIIENCWIDVAIYSIINMWYTHIVKEVQESLLTQLSIYDSKISKVYVTSYDEELQKVSNYRCPFRRYNVKHNRKLELSYYRLASNLKGVETLPTSDRCEAVDYIIEDLRNLGYL